MIFKRLSDYGLMAVAAITSLVVLILIYVSQTQFEENVTAIFDNQRGHFDTTLAVRSNEYLVKALEDLPQAQEDPEIRSRVLNNLELAYAYLNFGEYRQSFDCIEPSLERIVEIRESFLINRSELSDTAPLWSAILSCQKLIIAEQTIKKGALASTVIERAAESRKWFTVGIVLAYAVGVLLWLAHERQRDRLVDTLRDKLRWQRRAETDHLTGCYNRLALEDALKERLQDRTTLAQATLFMYDIDYFKNYNDRYGHVKGDEVLKQVVAAVESVLRAEDRQFRYGGEEFIVLSEHMDDDSTNQVAHRILDAVRALRIQHESSPFGQVTISLGVCRLSNDILQSEQAVQQADKHLYAAKARGRNQFAY